MKTSKKGLDLLKRFEGLRTSAYLDSVGVCTIGYGHTAAAGHPEPVMGMKLSIAECEAILQRDLGKYEADVLRLVKMPMSQEQFDALVSFHFNTGKLGRSTLLKKLNAGLYNEVPGELMKWVNAGGQRLAGLVKRRAAEADLWRSGTVPPPPDIETIPAKPKPGQKGAAVVIGAGSAAGAAVAAGADPIIVAIVLALAVAVAAGVFIWRKKRASQ